MALSSDCGCAPCTLSSDCSTEYPSRLFYSTNLNSYIDSYETLAARIGRTLGAPVIPLQITDDQVFENIAIALEMFTKYAGYTKEALVFDSKLYTQQKGIRLDTLFTLSKTINYWRDDAKQNPGDMYKVANMVFGDPYSPYKVQPPGAKAINTKFCGCENMEIFKDVDGKYYRGANPNDYELLNTYDYMINDYRKVVNVTYFEEGSNTGINTLFTIEQSLAQQAYFSYALGNFGFDLISWHALKSWLKDRNKYLASNRQVSFDKRTQYMRLWPEPKNDQYQFYGIIECYVERPVQDLLKEEWVYRYALALTKITLGYIRGLYQGAQLAGNVSISADIGAQGLQERDKLEDELRRVKNPGFGEIAAPGFYIG